MELLGWIGSILLAICALPEVLITIKTKQCYLTWGLLLCWFFGEIFLLIPILFEIKEPFLIFNYSTNIVLLLYLIYYKFKT